MLTTKCCHFKNSFFFCLLLPQKSSTSPVSWTTYNSSHPRFTHSFPLSLSLSACWSKGIFSICRENENEKLWIPENRSSVNMVACFRIIGNVWLVRLFSWHVKEQKKHQQQRRQKKTTSKWISLCKVILKKDTQHIHAYGGRKQKRMS